MLMQMTTLYFNRNITANPEHLSKYFQVYYLGVIVNSEMHWKCFMHGPEIFLLFKCFYQFFGKFNFFFNLKNVP